MDESGYSAFSFGTLWQEATRAVGYTWASIADMVGIGQQSFTDRKKIEEASRTARFELLLNSNKGAEIYTIIFVIAILVILYFVMKDKKA